MRTGIVITLLAALLLAGASVLLGQSESCVETATGDSTFNGQWASGCESEDPEYYARYYRFTLTQEAEVTITLESTDADAFLLLREGAALSGDTLDENDDDPDGGDTTNSRIRALLSAGTYTAEATTYSPGATGSFILTISGISSTGTPQPTPLPTVPSTPQPPARGALYLSSANDHVCVLLDNGEVECFVVAQVWQPEASTYGGFTHIDSGDHHTCGRDEYGSVSCWGQPGYGLWTYDSNSQLITASNQPSKYRSEVAWLSEITVGCSEYNARYIRLWAPHLSLARAADVEAPALLVRFADQEPEGQGYIYPAYVIDDATLGFGEDYSEGMLRLLADAEIQGRNVAMAVYFDDGDEEVEEVISNFEVTGLANSLRDLPC